MPGETAPRSLQRGELFIVPTEQRIRAALERREVQGFVLDRTTQGLIDKESARGLYAQLLTGSDPIEVMGRLLTVTELTSSLYAATPSQLGLSS